MKKLKFVQKGYENYSGPIGQYEFVNGVSTEPISQASRDRLCTAFQFAEIDADGSEQPSGVAHRLVAERALRAPVLAPLDRQTEVEKAAEAERDRELAELRKLGERKIYTEAEIDAVIARGGIKALREEISDIWGVKHRSIPVLRAMVLDAQKAYTAKIGLRLTKEAQQREAEKVAKPVTEQPVTEQPAELSAAETGDLSAAITEASGAE